MATSKFFVVCVEDTVVQLTTYLVRANDSEHARALMEKGMFAFESDQETVDTIDTQIKSVEELQ